MKNEKSNAANVAENATNNVENVNNETNTQNAETLTPEQEKASQVLRAKLPALAAAGLNFEKRTGNFFMASLVKEVEKNADGSDKTDKNGRPVYVIDPETNKPVEKVRRLVVELTDENGEILPQYADALADINAKRAAAMVLNGEKGRAKLEADKAEAEKRVAECTAALATFDADLANALEVVAAVELPERAPRATVAVKLQAVEDENAKLRAKLIAAGINPDE